MNLNHKQMIMTSRFGGAASEFSRWRTLSTSVRPNPEAASSAANEVIAERLITRLCRPGRAFADVGAHIGLFLSQVHRHDRSVQVLAFEAEPDKAQALARRFPWCEVFAVAVGERDGEVALTLDAQASGYNSIVDGRVAGGRTIDVPLAPLDALIGTREVDVIKIDVEGAELGVLRGATGLVDRCRPTIMFESIGVGENALGYSPGLIWDWCADRGYELFTPDRVAHDASPLGRETFLDGHEYPFRSHDYVAVDADRRVEIRDRARAILGITA